MGDEQNEKNTIKPLTDKAQFSSWRDDMFGVAMEYGMGTVNLFEEDGVSDEYESLDEDEQKEWRASVGKIYGKIARYITHENLAQHVQG